MGNESGSSALKRIHTLLDESSFVEIGGLVEPRSTDFNMNEKKQPNDGVVTGYGTIEGALVYVYAQDNEVMGGSMGEMHAKKIASLYDMAMKMGAPVIGILDSTGVRLEEASDALYGLGKLYQKKTLASGVIPQISAIFGPCGGGMAVMAALSDFTYMEKDKGRLFVTPSDAVLGNKDEKYAMAESQSENGSIDFAGSEEEIFKEIRSLVSILPSSNEEEGGLPEECSDDLNRSVAGIEKMEILEAIRQLSDEGFFIETRQGYAKDIVTGFILFNSRTVGVVANAESALSWRGAEQAAYHVSFCDAFGIPVLTLVDLMSYRNSQGTEQRMAKAAAKLSYVYSDASVPMVTLIKKAYGSAGLSFGSKALGADIVYAYPNSEIALMDADKTAEILCEDEAQRKDLARDIREKQVSAIAAAKRGYVDDIISPEESRQRLCAAFEMLYTKSVYRPDKKHGTA